MGCRGLSVGWEKPEASFPESQGVRALKPALQLARMGPTLRCNTSSHTALKAQASCALQDLLGPVPRVYRAAPVRAPSMPGAPHAGPSLLLSTTAFRGPAGLICTAGRLPTSGPFAPAVQGAGCSTAQSPRGTDTQRRLACAKQAASA